jgi:cytochrome c oxidase cbb3-type subunit III
LRLHWKMLFYSKSLGLIAVLCIVASVRDARSQAATPAKPAPTVNGKKIFATNCSLCHGLDGKGTERAPNISDSPKVRGYSDSRLFEIVHDGVAGTGMPSFNTLSKSQIEATVAYVRTLEGGVRKIKVEGDPVAGKEIFYGEAGCSRCHTVAGEGGFIASDLSDYAREHQPEEVRTALKEPTVTNYAAVKLVTVELRDGREFTGRVRNEDNFAIQLQSQDGVFHVVARDEIVRMEADLNLQMPDYSSKLGPREIDDLIVYLIDASHVSKAAAAEKPKKQPDD